MIENYKLRSATSMFQDLTIKDLAIKTEVKFAGFDLGKLTVFYVEGNKVIFKQHGQNAWYAIGATKYYPPRYLIGCVVGSEFIKQGEIQYTKETMKQAKEEALKKVKELRCQKERK